MRSQLYLDLSAIIAAYSQFSQDLLTISAICQQLSHARRSTFSLDLPSIRVFAISLALALQANLCRPNSYKYGFADFGGRCQLTFSRPLVYNCSFHLILFRPLSYKCILQSSFSGPHSYNCFLYSKIQDFCLS